MYTNNEQVFHYFPKLVLPKMRFHIVDNTSFHYGFAVISRIDQVLKRGVHRVSHFDIGAKKEVAEVSSDMSAFKAF